METAALIMGILPFFRLGMQKAKQGLATNRGDAEAGFICWMIIIVAAGASSSY